MAMAKAFEDFARNGTADSDGILRDLLNIEDRVNSGNREEAIGMVETCLSNLSNEYSGSELENLGDSCCAVRSALIYSMAAVQHAKNSWSNNQLHRAGKSSKWCMIKVFNQIKAVSDLKKSSENDNMPLILEFLFELMKATYGKVFEDGNSEIRDQNIDSAFCANMIATAAMMCRPGVTDTATYSEKAINLLEGVENEAKLKGSVYETAGICHRKGGNYEKAKYYLLKAKDIAREMPETVPNEDRIHLLQYIDNELVQLKKCSGRPTASTSRHMPQRW